MIERKWQGWPGIVAATGPSLTKDVATLCEAARTTHKIIAVNDAYRLLPFADLLYACDRQWWELHKGCAGFAGEKWTSYGDHHGRHRAIDKTTIAERYGLKLIAGVHEEGFSLNPGKINYGSNSGFQGVNLAILFGLNPIVLVGFDMHTRNGRHFFGNHPAPLNNSANYQQWAPIFHRAARTLPAHIKIINATPGSAITCWTMMELPCALSVGCGPAKDSGNAPRTTMVGTSQSLPQCSIATAATR